MVKINQRIAVRREQQLENLVLAAENAVICLGMDGLKARQLADEIGISLGMIYNLVEDMDELVLRVSAKTLGKLDDVLAPKDTTHFTTTAESINRLVDIALLYRKFASDHTNQWRALFEYRIPENKTMPESLVNQQEHLLSHIAAPVRILCPLMNHADLALNVRMMFSAVHGVISLGLDKKMVAVPADAMDFQLESLVRMMCSGLANKQ